MHLLVLGPHDIPLILALALVLLDDVPGVWAAVHDVPALLLAADFDLAVEGLRHGDDVGIRLVPRDGVGEAFGSLFAFDGEGPEEGTEEGDQLGLREVDAGAGAVAVAERCVATEVGEFGERLLVGRVGGIDPALGLEFCGIGVERFLAGDQAG